MAGIVDGLGGWAMSACCPGCNIIPIGSVVTDTDGDVWHSDCWHVHVDIPDERNAWRERALAAEALVRAKDEAIGELLLTNGALNRMTGRLMDEVEILGEALKAIAHDGSVREIRTARRLAIDAYERARDV